MQGSLQQIGIAEMIQFPAQSNRSGRLVVERNDQRAELYYVDGELRHAALEALTGFAVLVEILPWTTGRFTFEVGVQTEESTIDMDLGKAMLRAMAQAEERAGDAEEADPHVKATAGLGSFFGPDWDPALFGRMFTFLSDHRLFIYACVMDTRGRIKSEFIKPQEELGGSAEAYPLLRDIGKNYAFMCQDRMLVQSSYCTVAIRRFGDGLVCIALARPTAEEPDVEIAMDALVLKLQDPVGS